MADFGVDDSLLSIEEVAEILDKSVATVRRWCVAGKLPARKSGRQWVIRRADLPSVNRSAAQSRGHIPYDVDQAVRHISATDRNELWVPDILRWEDHLGQPAGLKQRALARLQGSEAFDAATDVEVPKTAFFSRNATMLSLEDRIAYQASVAVLAPRIDNGLSTSVYSARLLNSRRFFLRKGVDSWVDFKDDVVAAATSYPWTVKTDITAYFDNIQHSMLFRDLDGLSSPPKPVRSIKQALSTWTEVPGLGIPQGPNASRLLGNLYLAAVDRAMTSNLWVYARYQDDIRILAKTRHHALEGLRLLERECRRRGLSLATQKTELLHGQAQVSADFEDYELDRVVYHLSVRHNTKARRRLKAILTEAIQKGGRVNARRTKFALWRLALLRDGSQVHRVLDNLEYLGPVASVTAAYLRPWLKRARVQSKLSSYLQNEERNVYPLMSTWLMAAMLDYRSPLPSEWIEYARAVTRNRNQPAYHRVMAANVMTRGHDGRDVGWLESELLSEHDPEVLRGYFVALARVGHLNKGLANRTLTKVPTLQETYVYLQGRNNLPSLLYPDLRVEVPSR